MYDEAIMEAKIKTCILLSSMYTAIYPKLNHTINLYIYPLIISIHPPIHQLFSDHPSDYPPIVRLTSICLSI